MTLERLVAEKESSVKAQQRWTKNILGKATAVGGRDGELHQLRKTDFGIDVSNRKRKLQKNRKEGLAAWVQTARQCDEHTTYLLMFCVGQIGGHAVVLCGDFSGRAGVGVIVAHHELVVVDLGAPSRH